MGYYATGGGSISFLAPLTKEQKKAVEDALDQAWYEFDLYQNDSVIDFWVPDKYCYDTDMMLNRIAEIAFVESGSCSFAGEDGEHWRFVYDPKSNKFLEEDGTVVYGFIPRTWDMGSSNRKEFLGQIMDGIEDFLESKNKNPTGGAILRGQDYDRLSAQIEDTLVKWGVLPGKEYETK